MAKKSKRLLSLVLAVMMLLTMFPITMPVASAADSVSVDTWEELRDALKSETNKVVTLTKDISYEAYDTGYYGVTADIVLDLNGYEIKVKNTYDMAFPEMESGCREVFFNIFDGGCLTINDSSKNGDGKITFESYVNSASDFEKLPIRDLFDVFEGGTLIVNGGTLQAGTIKKEWVTLFPYYNDDSFVKKTGNIYKLCYGTAVTVNRGGKAIINGGTFIGHGAGSLWHDYPTPEKGKVYDDFGEIYYGAAVKTNDSTAQVIINNGTFNGYAGADAIRLYSTDTLSRVYGGVFETQGRDDALVKIDIANVWDIKAGDIGIKESAVADHINQILVFKKTEDSSSFDTFANLEDFRSSGFEIDETGHTKDSETKISVIPDYTEKGRDYLKVNYYYSSDYYYKDAGLDLYYYNPNGSPSSPANVADFKITSKAVPYYSYTDSVEGFSRKWVWNFYTMESDTKTLQYTTSRTTDTINLKDVLNTFDFTEKDMLYITCTYYECYGNTPLPQYKSESFEIKVKITETPLLKNNLDSAIIVNETYDGSNRVNLAVSPDYSTLRSKYTIYSIKTYATYKNSSGTTKTQEFWSNGKFITDSLAEGKTRIDYETVITGQSGEKATYTSYDFLYNLPDMTVSNATLSGEKYIGDSGSTVTLTAPAISGVTNPYIGWFKLGADGTYETINNTSWGRTSWNVTQAGTYCYALQPNDGKNANAVYSDPVTIEFEDDYNTITVTPSATSIAYTNDTAQENNISFTVTYGTGFSGGKSNVRHELISWPAGAEEAIEYYGNGYNSTSFTLNQFLPTSAKDVNTIVPGEYVFRTKATNTTTGKTYYSAPVTITVKRYATGIDIVAEKDKSILNADTYWTDNKYRATYYTAYVGEDLQLISQPNDGASPLSGTLTSSTWTVESVVGTDVATISNSGVLSISKPGRVLVTHTEVYVVKGKFTYTYTQTAYIDIPITEVELTMGTPTLDSNPQEIFAIPEDAPYTLDVRWDYCVNESTNKFYKNKYPKAYIDIIPNDGYVVDLVPESDDRPLFWYGTFANTTLIVNGEETDLDFFDKCYFYDWADSYYYYSTVDAGLTMTLVYTFPEKLIDENDTYESFIEMNVQVPSIHDNVDMVIPEDPDEWDLFTLNAEVLTPGFSRIMDTDIYMVDSDAAADFDVTNDNEVKADPAAKYEAGQLYRVQFTVYADTILAEDGETYHDAYFADNVVAYVNGTYCLIEKMFTDDKYAKVTYYFTPEEFTRISEVDIIGVKAPVANEEIVEDWNVVQDDIYISRAQWFVDANENGILDEGEEVTGDYFGFDTAYSLYVELECVDEDFDGLGDEARFESSVTVKVGDETADNTMTGNYNGAVYTYPATGEMEELAYNDDSTSIDTYVNEAASYDTYDKVSGGAKPYTFAKVEGPGWLSINSATGVISGTPTKTYESDGFVFTVTDANGDSVEAEIYVWPVHIKPEDREVISSVTATTDIKDILVYGGAYKIPTYTVDSPASFLDHMRMYAWEIKNENDEWVDFEGDYFLEGTYRIVTQVRVDGSAGVTHMFDANEVLPVTVDGEDWNTAESKPGVYDKYSFMWVQSPEYTITKPEDVVIEEIEITGVSSPNLGYSVTGTYPIYKLPEGALYTVTATKWFRNIGTTPAEDEVFEENRRYAASFDLKVAPGYEFASEEDITVTINGVEADMVYVYSDGTAIVRLLMEPKAHVEGVPVRENVIEPTCTTPGSCDWVFYCTECGEEIRRYGEYLNALGHTWDEENGVVTYPTCTDEGYTTYTCTVCGETENHDYVDARGHGEGQVMVRDEVNSTCTEEGSYDNVTYCTRCGDEIARETVITPAKGHRFQVTVTNEVAPTCTVAGSRDEERWCDVCGHEETETVVVPATGHTPADAVKENIVEATESATGSYDSVVYCSVCGAEISRTTVVIPVIGSGTTVGGNYTSFNSDTDTVTIALFADGSETALQTLSKTGNTGTYEFENVADGTYTIVISKNNHVTRTYTVEVKDGQAVTQDLKIHLKGDISGDGKITVLDYSKAQKHVKKTSLLEGYEFDCADVTGDGKITVLDYSKLLKHVKKTEVLW